MDCGVLPKNISVIGLGKLGAPMLAVLGARTGKSLARSNDSCKK